MVRNARSDNSQVKKSNQSLILNTIFTSGIISRADIAKRLQMSKPAVNEHIDALLQIGILQELGEGSSNAKGGRRPILLAPNSEYRYIIALDLNFTRPVVALGTITGSPVDKFFIEINNDLLSVRETVSTYVDELIYRNKLSYDKIGAIVISTPGIVNGKTGDIIFNPQFEDLQRINFKHFLEQKYPFPIIIKNDVKSAAIGEAKCLNPEQGENLLYISCGRGLGAAMIIKGVLYEGDHYAAGEINTYVFGEDGQRVEDRVCIHGLLKAVQDRLWQNPGKSSLSPEDISFKAVVAAYQAGDELVFQVLRDIARSFCMVISNTVAVLDIKTVVVGGEYIVFQNFLIPELKRLIGASPLIHKPDILPTALGYAGGIMGCFEIGVRYMIRHLEQS